MIRFILLQNRSGKTRLSKWYVPFDEEEKEKLKTEVHRLITTREARFTNFVEYRTYKIIYSGLPRDQAASSVWRCLHNVVRGRYAGLYFSFCVDVSDNELAYLETRSLAQCPPPNSAALPPRTHRSTCALAPSWRQAAAPAAAPLAQHLARADVWIVRMQSYCDAACVCAIHLLVEVLDHFF
eukprot:gene9402-1691_t